MNKGSTYDKENPYSTENYALFLAIYFSGEPVDFYSTIFYLSFICWSYQKELQNSTTEPPQVNKAKAIPDFFFKLLSFSPL